MGDAFVAYAAGFWDGEGWVVIGLERGNETRSDVHHIGVYATQRARYREVLDRFQAEFGGTVSILEYKIRGKQNWADKASWHIHTRPQIERFCLAVQPYCIVKAEQLAIALEFVTGYEVLPGLRDTLGRVRGGRLSAQEVERRERLRLALKVANAKEPQRTAPLVREPRPAHHIDRSAEVPTPNHKTVSRGESRYNSVLTEAAVREIRAVHAVGGVTLEATAAQYGVSPAAIRQVIRRISWRHVTDLPSDAPSAQHPTLFDPDA